MINKEEWLKLKQPSVKKHLKDAAKSEYEMFKGLLGDVYCDSIENIYEQHEKLFNEDMKYEPFQCKEYVNGISITSYLDKIRYSEKEHLLYLFIKDNKVIKEMIFEGDYESCGENGEDVIAFEEAKKLKADICIYHNHPYRYAAIPSGGYRRRKDKDGNVIYAEAGDYAHYKTLDPKLSEKYNVNIIDMGVVTEVDFYSVKQKGLFIKHDERE